MIEWKEQKTAAKAQMGHAPIVTKNIELYFQGTDLSKTGKKYKGSMEMILVSNGRVCSGTTRLPIEYLTDRHFL